MERFVQPCLLLLLSEAPAHGYALLGALEEFCPLEPADPGAMYRTLRRMEDDRLVESEWETGGSGPARRLYRITDDGQTLLSAWVDNIRHNITMLEGFVARYEQRPSQP